MPDRTRGVQPWQLAVLGASFGLAGLSKLLDLGMQRRLFRRWGYTPEFMHAVGAAEVSGALLLAAPPSRRLGAAGLTAVAAGATATVLRNRETVLAFSALPLLWMALAAATAPDPPSGSRARGRRRRGARASRRKARPPASSRGKPAPPGSDR